MTTNLSAIDDVAAHYYLLLFFVSRTTIVKVTRCPSGYPFPFVEAANA
jgi:hypothetical protein